jgi:DNA-binding NarL/FixJ family response regulator
VSVSRLTERVLAGLAPGGAPPDQVVAVVRDAFSVERVSLARIDDDEGIFEITAEDGARLLSPGTALPLQTCSYFSDAAGGTVFGEIDFEGSADFRRPFDAVIMAAGFHSGCSIPIRRDGHTVGALSLSAFDRRREIPGFVAGLEAVTDALGSGWDPVPTSPPANVLVCCDDMLVAQAIAQLAGGGERAEGTGGTVVVATLQGALDRARQTPPDVVICDDWLDGLRVDEVAACLRGAGVSAPLVVVCSRDTPEARRAALRAAAAAYVPHSEAVRTLTRTLMAVRRGGRLVPKPSPDTGPALTRRERELVRLLEEGARFKQVAVQLGISEATAKTHGRNLFRKLGASSRAEAVHLAREQGLLA